MQSLPERGLGSAETGLGHAQGKPAVARTASKRRAWRAARLAALAKIDATQATSAAPTQVPESVLKVALDNENGNLVYSVEIKTASNEIKDVKVDAGNGAVVHMDAANDEEDAEE